MKVSVALCTYNGERFLDEQLKSILNQLKPGDEVIICDDCSQDQTVPIIQHYSNQYPGIIQLCINDQNLGGKKNFEKALSLCTGDIIFFSDQDDIWQPEKVEIMVTELQNRPQCLGAFSDGYLIRENGGPYSYSFLDSFGCTLTDRAEFIKKGACDYVLTFSNIVAGAMLAIKKEAIPLVYPFKLMDKMWHDEWIALVLSSVNKFMFVDQKLIQYRLHPAQQLGIGEEDGYDKHVQYLNILKDYDEMKKRPLEYFSHTWMAYNKVRNYEKEIKELHKFKNAYKNRFQYSKIHFLRQYNFFIRKARIIKWLINNEFDTTWRDVFKL